MHDLTTTPKARATQGRARRSPSRSPEAHQTAGVEVRSETAAVYRMPAAIDAEAHEAAVLAEAEQILRRRFERMATLSSPSEYGA